MNLRIGEITLSWITAPYVEWVPPDPDIPSMENAILIVEIIFIVLIIICCVYGYKAIQGRRPKPIQAPHHTTHTITERVLVICPYCSAKIELGKPFCPHCGGKI